MKKEDIIMGRAAAYYGVQALTARHEADDRRHAEKAIAAPKSSFAKAYAAYRRWCGDGYSKLWRSA
ncbi:MAG: hypothetical protein RIC87_17725 [Kiloniellales bacterium]